MKTFKQFYEKAPNTSDAMKRYKSGKAGFTDIAHLKACLLYTSPSPRDRQ